MKPRRKKVIKAQPKKPAEPAHRFGHFKLPPRHHIKGLVDFDPQNYELDGSDGSDNKRRVK